MAKIIWDDVSIKSVMGVLIVALLFTWIISMTVSSPFDYEGDAYEYESPDVNSQDYRATNESVVETADTNLTLIPNATLPEATINKFEIPSGTIPKASFRYYDVFDHNYFDGEFGDAWVEFTIWNSHELWDETVVWQETTIWSEYELWEGYQTDWWEVDFNAEVIGDSLYPDSLGAWNEVESTFDSLSNIPSVVYYIFVIMGISVVLGIIRMFDISIA